MGICCFCCAQKAAEIFHIREMLYKKGIVWPGVCREENNSDDDSSNKKLPLLSTLVGIACLFSSSDFLSQVSPCTSQKHLPICPWRVTSSRSPLGKVSGTNVTGCGEAVQPALLHRQCESRAGGAFGLRDARRAAVLWKGAG